MTKKTANRLVTHTSRVDEQIASIRDRPIASTTENTNRNSIESRKRKEKITYFTTLAAAAAAALAASVLSPMLRLSKKSLRSGKKLSVWRNSSSDDDIVMPVVAPERSPKT